MLKVGDLLGGIYCNSDGEWYLTSDKITKIVENSKGKKYYTKSKWHPLDAKDVDDTTEEQIDAFNSNYVITKEVFGLDELEDKVNEWIEWANENKDKVSMF